MSSFDRTLNQVKSILTDPVKFQNFIRNNKKDVLYWGLLVIAIIVFYFMFSDGDFSFCLTLSGTIQMFGFLLITLKVLRTGNCSGLSLQTLICYGCCFFFKTLSVLFYEGYLPYDSSGDFVYRLVEAAAFILSGVMIYLVHVKFRSSYNWDLDRINCVLFIVPTFLLALFVHPSLNNSYWADAAWAFSLYLESVAMFPQIYLFTKKGGEIEAFTSHYVASQGISRLLAFIFWIFSFHELNEIHGEGWGLIKSYVGHIVMLAQLIQMVILGDFVFHYLRSLQRGMPMTLPTYVV